MFGLLSRKRPYYLAPCRSAASGTAEILPRVEVPKSSGIYKEVPSRWPELCHDTVVERIIRGREQRLAGNSGRRPVPDVKTRFEGLKGFLRSKAVEQDGTITETSAAGRSFSIFLSPFRSAFSDGSLRSPFHQQRRRVARVDLPGTSRGTRTAPSARTRTTRRSKPRWPKRSSSRRASAQSTGAGGQQRTA